MDANIRSYYEALGSEGEISAYTVGYRSERAWHGMRAALEMLFPPGTTGLSILDVGCGHGRMTRDWTVGNRVVGLDAAFNLLRLARSNGLMGVQGDALDLPFADSSFDVALAIELLQQVTDASTLLQSLTRVTRVGGTVIIATANRWSVIRQAVHAGVELGFVPRGMPRDIPLPLLRSAREILEIAEGLPLELETMGTTYYPWTFGHRHLRMGILRSLLATNFLLKFRRTG